MIGHNISLLLKKGKKKALGKSARDSKRSTCERLWKVTGKGRRGNFIAAGLASGERRGHTNTGTPEVSKEKK